MIDPEMRVKSRRYSYAEHWKVGTIAQALGVHPDTVKQAIEVERFHRTEQLRSSKLDPYVGFVRQTLEAHPGYFEHLDPERNGPQDRMQRLCPELIGGSGESLSMNTAEQEEALARDVVDRWMHSPGHRKNLLSVTHTHMGIHLCQAGWRVYATQFFADLQVEFPMCTCCRIFCTAARRRCRATRVIRDRLRRSVKPRPQRRI